MSKNKNEAEHVVPAQTEANPVVLEPVAEGIVALEGIVDGPPHGVLIKLIRPVGREDINAGVGDIIGEIIMAEGCGDFNFMVDAIRNGFAGEA
jgi:hypothetical protein